MPRRFESLWSLPPAARGWWFGIVALSVCLVPVCLTRPDAGLPVAVLLLVPVLNAIMVVATAPLRRQSTLVPTFDYGGIATVALLAGFGPAAALAAFAGEKLAAAVLADASGRRPSWVKSVYNLAWGSPCILFSWALGGLAPDRSLEPVLVALGWWLSNGVLVATMVTLAGRKSAAEGIRLALTHEGWLRMQELTLSALAVIAWWTNPTVLVAVLLLVIGQAMTWRRLIREHERAAAAREQARIDPLTGLANRLAYEEALLAQPPPAAALVLDLDHFKRINDTFGHDVGDRVLVGVSSVLRSTLGSVGLCARLGGEEFCALLSGTYDDAELLDLGDRVRLAVSALRFAQYPALHPTASIGLAPRLPRETSPREAVTRADQALYAAKRDGRNRTYLAGAPAALAA